jgi:hypothetical protein
MNWRAAIGPISQATVKPQSRDAALWATDTIRTMTGLEARQFIEQMGSPAVAMLSDRQARHLIAALDLGAAE